MQGERPDLPEADSTVEHGEIMGAYDAIDETPVFVVADIAQEDAWLAMAVGTVLDLDTWQ